MSGLLSALRGLFGRRSDGPSPEAFTALVLARLRERVPGSDIQHAGGMELVVRATPEGEQRVFLDNAYRVYSQAREEEREAVLERFLQAYAEAAGGLERSAERVVPMVKAETWLEQLRASLQTMRSDGQVQDNVVEPLGGGLVVVYALDMPSNIAYLSPQELDEFGLAREALRAHAVRNLRGLLPRIEVHRGPQLSMATADGNYEASLLLFDDFWVRECEHMRGPPAVAVPGHDLLVFCDSADAAAVAQLRALATRMHREAARPLTAEVFLRSEAGLAPLE